VPKREAEEIVKGDVRSFIATSDGNAVFFVNDDDEIQYQKGYGKSVTVTYRRNLLLPFDGWK